MEINTCDSPDCRIGLGELSENGLLNYMGGQVKRERLCL